MSMLSAQCDELRAMAKSVGLAMPQAATLMMEAADTILSLRDRAQELQAENAKLREYIERKRYLQDFARLVDENSKLRKLVRIAGTYCVNGYCGKDDGCPLYLGKPYCALSDRMRELGIEVEV